LRALHTFLLSQWSAHEHVRTRSQACDHTVRSTRSPRSRLHAPALSHRRARARSLTVSMRESRRAPSRWRSAVRGCGDADHHGDDDREGEDAQRRGGRRLVVDAALRPRSKQRCESGPRSEQPWQESSSTQGCTRDGSGAACAGPRSGPEGAHPLRRQCSDVLPST
jgi:hypothetical protein